MPTPLDLRCHFGLNLSHKFTFTVFMIKLSENIRKAREVYDWTLRVSKLSVAISGAGVSN